MGAAATQRGDQVIHRHFELITDCQREKEALFMDRNRPLMQQSPAALLDRRTVRCWMQRNAEGVENETTLAECAVSNFKLPESILDNETHWIWEDAITAWRNINED